MELISRTAPTLGRVLLAVLFLAAGANKLQSPTATIAYIQQADLPLPLIAYWGSALVEVVGALLLLLGFQARLAAAILAAFTVVAAAFFHADFGNANQTIHFMKNVAIAGGLIQVVAFGAGPFSLDSRRSLRAAASGMSGKT